MAFLEPVHVMEMDRATQKMVCVRVNPTRTYARVGPYGTSFITWQNGQWYGAGGTPLADADVPEEYAADLAAHPVRIEEDGPAVIVRCDICREPMNRSLMEQHLITHVRDAMALAGTTRVTPGPPPAPESIPPSTTFPPKPGSRPVRPDAA
jgi:hypothetical protein